MKVTKVEEQGVRLALSLARHGGRGSLKDLADREQLSLPLVAKILGKLRRGGVVRALRGRNGCYELDRPPEQISVADVLLALSPAVVRGCFNAEPADRLPCPHATGCSLRPVWSHLERTVTDVLDQITLLELQRREGQVRRQVVRLWQDPSAGARRSRFRARSTCLTRGAPATSTTTAAEVGR